MNKPTQVSIGFALSLLLLALLGHLLLGAPSSRLPDPIAIHWGLSGKATSSVPFSIFRILALGTLLVLCALQLRALVEQALADAPLPSFGNLKLPATSLSVSSVVLLTLWNNLDAPNWEAARLSWPALGLTVATILGLTTGAARDKAPASPGPKARLGLSSDERATWIKQVHAPKALWIGVSLLLLILLVFDSSKPSAYFRFALGLLAMVSIAWIRVHISNEGLRVYYGFWPVAFTRIPLSEIQDASVEDIGGSSGFGGWGYRGSLRLFKQAKIMIRKGPGLRINLTRGRVLRITVDDAHTAAGLLNDLCEQRGA